MRRELLIAAGPGEWRAALVEGGIPVELCIERGDRHEAGSVHLGRVRRLLPGLAAALVDLGSERPAFLPRSETVPRGRPLHEGERVIVQIRREAQGGKAARVTERFRSPPAVTAEKVDLRGRDILDRAARLEPPARLDPAASFAAALSGTLLAVPSEILVDDPAAIPEIRAAFSELTVVQRPEAEWPIDLDEAFAEGMSETIALWGAGTVHFDAARAVVLIDVDSGTVETGSAERTGVEANLAAAAVIARQIRLRNLGGGIVVDFVGLDRRALRDEVRAAFAEALACDPAGPQILGWTRLGHLEVVRPRRGRPLAEALLEPRSGGGHVKTAVTMAYEVLRALRHETRAQPGRQWRLVVAPEVAASLAGAAMLAVQETERRFARKMVIEPDPALDRERFQIVLL